MIATIKAEEINLFDLKKNFGLERADDPQFFSEWQEDLSILHPSFLLPTPYTLILTIPNTQYPIPHACPFSSVFLNL